MILFIKKYLKNETTFLLMKKENMLILCLLRYHADKKDRDRLNELLKDKLDWNYILEFSRIQGVSPILYKTLKNLNFRKNILKEFEKDYIQTKSNNIIKYRELEKILKIFKKEKIEVILLKGIYLAKYVYQDIGLRPMSDIDLLVKRKDLERCEKVLRKKDYFFCGHRGSKQQCIKRKNHDFPYYNKKANCMIELHWKINLEHKSKGYSNPLMFPTFWNNELEIGDNYYYLSNEDMLVHLIGHITSHEMSIKIIQLVDILLLLSKFKVDWGYIYQKYPICKDKIYYTLNWMGLFFPDCVDNNLIKQFKPRIIYRILFKFIKKSLFYHYLNESVNGKIMDLLGLLIRKRIKYRVWKFIYILYVREYDKKKMVFFISKIIGLPKRVVFFFVKK